MRILDVIVVLSTVSFAQAPASSLPPVVKAAFEKAYPGATILSTSQERDGNRAAFRVDGTQNGKRRSVLYDAGGGVIEVAEQVDEKELPQPVAAAMHSHPRAVYVSGFKVTRGGSVEYRLTMRGTPKTAMVAKTDGPA